MVYKKIQDYFIVHIDEMTPYLKEIFFQRNRRKHESKKFNSVTQKTSHAQETFKQLLHFVK